MTTNHHSPPPEADLIRAAREAPPYMSIKKAAKAADISDTRWRQIEQGYRMHRGHAEAEPPAPAPILARMAHAVGVTGAELTSAGRADAAAELAAIPPAEMTTQEILSDMVRRIEELERKAEGRASGDGDVNGGRHAV